jgi:hypothetical protein
MTWCGAPSMADCVQRSHRSSIAPFKGGATLRYSSMAVAMLRECYATLRCYAVDGPSDIQSSIQRKVRCRTQARDRAEFLDRGGAVRNHPATPGNQPTRRSPLSAIDAAALFDSARGHGRRLPTWCAPSAGISGPARPSLQPHARGHPRGKIHVSGRALVSHTRD